MKIGSPYNDTVPIFALRSVPAMTGSLLIPLVYMIMLQLNYSQWTAALAAFLFLFGEFEASPILEIYRHFKNSTFSFPNADNALLTQSHYMLMEPILLFFALSGVLCVLKFRALERSGDAQGHSYGLRWWFWLVSGGVCLTCTLW